MTLVKDLDIFSKRIHWDEISPQYLRTLIEIGKNEDLRGSTLSSPPTAIPKLNLHLSNSAQKAYIIAREELVACGIHLIPEIINIYNNSDIQYKMQAQDGELLKPGTLIATLTGSPQSILTLERVLLNFLQHLSGIASYTKLHSNKLSNSTTRLLDTRKTTPGYRLLEKYAVTCGGGWNHRLGLFDRIMVKDNHLAAANATKGAQLTHYINEIKSQAPDTPIEVEVDNLSQIPNVLDANVDVILLDNFSKNNLQSAVNIIGDKAFTEASGGIGLESIEPLSQIGLDYISCGAITHQSTWKDIALDWSL